MKEAREAVKVLITGSNGQLGFELRKFRPEEIECRGVDLPEIDITNRDQVIGFCEDFRPDVLINAAAYTAVDQAETEEETAYAVNVDGAGNLAEAARSCGSRLIHISTDFVFDGASGRPCRVSDPAVPLGVYGKTKLLGEQAVLRELPDAVVIRTSWLYSSHGKNFVKTMLQLMGKGSQIRAVCDQVGTPTWAGGLAAVLWEVVRRPGLRGIYHWSDNGVASWYDFAVAIQEEAVRLGLLERIVEVLPIRGKDYLTPAARPSYSVMDISKIKEELGVQGSHWRENLRIMLSELIGE